MMHTPPQGPRIVGGLAGDIHAFSKMSNLKELIEAMSPGERDHS